MKVLGGTKHKAVLWDGEELEELAGSPRRVIIADPYTLVSRVVDCATGESTIVHQFHRTPQ